MVCKSAETQSGLPLLPWSCYASVIQCDIIQYLLFLFYYNTVVISFLALYNDTILCTIICVNERLYAKIRAVAGQRSSPDLCFATTSVKIYDPSRSLRWVMMVQHKTSDQCKVST